MLTVALKEWSIVCELLAEGSLALLLRKGGIHEDAGAGVFTLEHPRFALFPSYLHQKPQMIKPQFRDRVNVMEEPAEYTLSAMGEAAKIWEVPSRAAFDQLDDLHCWTPEQIDMRFNYKSDHPLYLVAIRAAKLASPKTILNDWRYGGCKSWIPLNEGDEVDDAGATRAIDDAAFDEILRRVDAAFSS
jgi:hypothetical protein